MARWEVLALPAGGVVYSVGALEDLGREVGGCGGCDTARGGGWGDVVRGGAALVGRGGDEAVMATATHALGMCPILNPPSNIMSSPGVLAFTTSPRPNDVIVSKRMSWAVSLCMIP